MENKEIETGCDARINDMSCLNDSKLKGVEVSEHQLIPISEVKLGELKEDYVASLAPYDRLLNKFIDGERDLLGFFMTEFVEILLEGGNGVTQLIEFGVTGARRNLPNDADAVWSYLRIVDLALVHGRIADQDKLPAIAAGLTEIKRWSAGLAKGVGRVVNGARTWGAVQKYTEALIRALPGLGSSNPSEGALIELVN